MEVFFIWLLFALLVGVLASNRGRSGVGFFLLSAILSPLIGLIVVLVIRDLAAEARHEEIRLREEAERTAQRQDTQAQQIAALKALSQAPAAPAAASPLSVAQEIEKLGDLLQRGLLTEAEFQEQKTAVLRRTA